MTWGAIRHQGKAEETDRETWPGYGRVEFQQLTYCAGEASPEQPMIFGRAFESPPFFTWSGVLRRNEPDADEWPGGGVPALRAVGEGAEEFNKEKPIPLPTAWEADDFVLLLIENNGHVVEADPDNPTGNYMGLAESADLGVAGIYYGDSSDWNLIGSQASAAIGFADTTRLTAYWARAYEGMPMPIVADPGATNHQVSQTYSFFGIDWVNGPIHSTNWSYEDSDDDSHTLGAVSYTFPYGALGINSWGTVQPPILQSASNSIAENEKIFGQHSDDLGTDGGVACVYGQMPGGGSSGTTTLTYTGNVAGKVGCQLVLLGKTKPDRDGNYGPGVGPWDLSNLTIGVKEWIQDDAGAYVGAYLWYKIDKIEEV